MRKAVRDFALVMEAQLAENDHKGGWSEKECGIEYLKAKMLEEVAELFKSAAGFHGNDPAREAVDVANFCMMLWTRFVPFPVDHQR